MGMASWFKYLRLLSLGSIFARKLLNWLDTVTEKGSPGGEDITMGEWASLAMVIADSIMEATGQLVEIEIKPK